MGPHHQSPRARASQIVTTMGERNNNSHGSATSEHKNRKSHTSQSAVKTTHKQVQSSRRSRSRLPHSLVSNAAGLHSHQQKQHQSPTPAPFGLYGFPALLLQSELQGSPRARKPCAPQSILPSPSCSKCSPTAAPGVSLRDSSAHVRGQATSHTDTHSKESTESSG